MQDRAYKSARGVASFIQERIKDELVREFDVLAPDFWFCVETELQGDRIHAHGGMMPVQGDHPKCDAKAALERAGGRWASSFGGEDHQADVRDLYAPYNWASYVLKRMNRTTKAIGGRTVAASRGMAVRTQARWPTLRVELPSA